ncbi:trichohyalin-like [Cyclospora cayetanensis]|uniref:Trichohyalin-like n=1 Tax=Cyclospora cayetanensis TaxID=88456 RepID=A0A6P6RUB2_9EIME|nr:trichohyalin-like [Cyclospora cayetanensis]
MSLRRTLLPQTIEGPWEVEGVLGLKSGPEHVELESTSRAMEGNMNSIGGSSTAEVNKAAVGSHFIRFGNLGSSHGLEQLRTCVQSLAEASLRNARLEAETQQLRHELILLKRRMQCESVALQAQHDAKAAEERAAWENEKQKLLFKNQALQTTVDQTLARYEEDVKLLGRARGSVLQQQQVEQQQQQQQLQLQMQQALHFEREHWSARLRAANDEWRKKLEDERREAEAKLLQAQQLKGPAFRELQSLILESRRTSDEFKHLLLSLQQHQRGDSKQSDAQCKVGDLDVSAHDERLAAMGDAVAALQQQQQALLLVAQETAALREDTEQRAQTTSTKLAEESLKLQDLHQSLLESRQKQHQLEQQQQEQLRQQQQLLEEQQQAFVHKQLQAEAEAATRQLDLEQAKEREIERRENRLAGAASFQEKQDQARREYWRTAESHLLKLQNELQKESCVFRQELTETALALDEKRRALRWCYEEIETQRYAIESRAAAAAAEAETAAEEARNARMLQQQGLQAKEALQQLHRKTKDAEKREAEQQEIIKSLVKELETSKLELLRMQQQSGQLYLYRRRKPLGPCGSRDFSAGTSRAQLPFIPHHRPPFSCRNNKELIYISVDRGAAPAVSKELVLLKGHAQPTKWHYRLCNPYAEGVANERIQHEVAGYQLALPGHKQIIPLERHPSLARPSSLPKLLCVLSTAASSLLQLEGFSSDDKPQDFPRGGASTARWFSGPAASSCSFGTAY